MGKRAKVEDKSALKDKASIAGKRSAGRPARSDATSGPAMLVDATCELLRELAPEKITLTEVARRSGVDPKLIRYYFKDRASLLRATAASLSQRFQEIAAAGHDPNDSPERVLYKHFATFLEFQLKYPYFRRLLVDEIIPSDAPESQELLQEITARGARNYQTILNDGQAQGSMRAIDPALFYLCVIGMQEMATIGGPLLRRLNHPIVDAPDYAEQFSKFALDLLINGLRQVESSK